MAGLTLMSDCCAALVRVEGRTTRFYVCTECNEPCDAVPDEVTRA